MEKSSKDLLARKPIQSTTEDEKAAMTLLLGIRGGSHPIVENKSEKAEFDLEMETNPSPSRSKRKFSEVELSNSDSSMPIPSSSVHRSKSELYILQYYQPRFYQVYQEYQQYLMQSSQLSDISLAISLEDHLLAMCLKHMIAFSCWVRKTPNISSRIKHLFEDNVDLRPEVRNGLSMILMYCFSAAQAKLRKDSDMFITLQDAETGLGIVNKTSLKIYNDPYQYFNFIKSCITGLIDAGKIPENERVGTPKKAKSHHESREELEAFEAMKNHLLHHLANREIDYIKQKIVQICNLWYRRQNIRSRRFIAALAILTTPEEITKTIEFDLLPPDVDVNQVMALGKSTNMSLQTESTAESSQALLQSPLSEEKQHIGSSFSRPSFLTIPPEASEDHGSERSIEENSFTSEKSNQLHTKRALLPLTTAPLLPSVEVVATVSKPSPASQPKLSSRSSSSFIMTYRFDRIALKEWQITAIPIYQIDSLLQSRGASSPIFYLLDEQKLFSDSSPTTLTITREQRVREMPLTFLAQQQKGMISLQQELATSRSALITSWLKADFEALKDFLASYLLHTSTTTAQTQTASEEARRGGCSSLIQYWQMLHPPVNSIITTTSPSLGVIAYEVTIQLGFVLRKQISLGIPEDCWRLLYLADVQQFVRDYSSSSFDQFLRQIFPQLHSLPNTTAPATTNNGGNAMVVKYYAHPLEPPVFVPPALAAPSAYQTIGLLSEATSTIFGRFHHEYVFHDLILQAYH